jgi:hypothetical protein
MDGAFECTIALDFRGRDFGVHGIGVDRYIARPRDSGRLGPGPRRGNSRGLDGRAGSGISGWREWLGVTRGNGLLADVPSDTDDASESADQPSDRNQSAGTPSAGAALQRDRRIGFGAALCQLGVIAQAPIAIGQHGVGAAYALHLKSGKTFQGRCVLRVWMEQTH